MENVLYTIGHSTHTANTVIELLNKHGITAVVDVRSNPYSRMSPQFNRESFSSYLKENGIAYVFLGRELGARSEDPNCYINDKVQFELLAQTTLFQSGLDRVIQGMNNYRVAIMCAEKDPLTCHRTILVCRHLLGHGIKVKHIIEDGRLESHEKALSRLLTELKMQERELFRSWEEITDEAYSRRAEQIAYKKSESTADMILREK